MRMRQLSASFLALAAACASPAGAAPPLWTDASATLPAKPKPGHSMNAKAVDIDADGDLDLVIAMEGGANRLLLNDGRARFADAADRMPATARDSEETAIADFDGDGDLDIAVANEDDLRPELYLNAGAAGFVDRSARLTVRVKANAVVALDADRDGRMDLFFGGDKVSHLLMGDGKGGFTDASAARLPDTFAGVQDVAVGDIDGDGDPDLVLGAEDRNQIYRNDGTGRFTLAPLPPAKAPEETRDAELADIDGDGDLDILFANVAFWNPRAVPQNRVLLNDGKGGFTDASARWWPHPPEATLSMTLVDLDEDGRPDLVTTAPGQGMVKGLLSGPVRAWRNTGTAFELTSWVPGGLDGNGNGFDAAVADFDGDGQVDVFVAGRAAPDLLLLSRKPSP